MGLFGGGNSTSQVKNEYITTTTNQGFSEVEGNVNNINGSNNTITDSGAIRGALDLAERSKEIDAGTFKEVISFVEGAQDKYTAGLQSFAEKVTQDEGANVVELGKWFAGGLALVAVGLAFRSAA